MSTTCQTMQNIGTDAHRTVSSRQPDAVVDAHDDTLDLDLGLAHSNRVRLAGRRYGTSKARVAVQQDSLDGLCKPDIVPTIHRGPCRRTAIRRFWAWRGANAPGRRRWQDVDVRRRQDTFHRGPRTQDLWSPCRPAPPTPWSSLQMASTTRQRGTGRGVRPRAQAAPIRSTTAATARPTATVTVEDSRRSRGLPTRRQEGPVPRSGRRRARR